MHMPVFLCFFHCQIVEKRLRVDLKARVFNRGMTYQFEKKDLTEVTDYFVGAVEIACYCLNEHFILPFI
jgi:hypothetical protein